MNNKGKNKELNVELSIIDVFKYFDLLDVNFYNAKNNIQMGIYVSLAELENAHMQTIFLKDKIKIKIDSNHIKECKQIDVLQCEFSHEILHALSSVRNNRKMKFNINEDEGIPLIGIDEACTQLFAEKVNRISLNKYQNYLYDLKVIMATLARIIGEDLLAQQYFNNNKHFSEKFNELTQGKFKEFCKYMEKLYILSKKIHYVGSTLEDLEEIDIYKSKINIIINSITENKKVK